MRIKTALLVTLSVSACVTTTVYQANPPFSGGWKHCEPYRGASICSWTSMLQNGVEDGSRVCAVRQDFATNSYYTHRLIGTANGNRVHFDRICGDPGSETNSFCSGQAPKGATNIGWASYDDTLHLCKGRLSSAPNGCTDSQRDVAMTPVSSDHLPLSEEDRDWLTSCVAAK